MKQQVQCPFEIRFSYLNYISRHKKPIVFYRVKITHIDANHTCCLSKEFITNVNRVTRGKSKYDLSKLTTVIDVVKHDPCIKTSSLQTLLKDCVPQDLWISAVFIRNFRQKVALYIAQHSEDGAIVTSDDARCLTLKSNVSATEYMVTNDPLVRINYLSVLRDVMQNGTTTWHALGFLRKMQSIQPGLSYRLRYDENQLPDAIMWMTPDMKNNLIRYGDVMFLDAQKNEYNHFGWPYIGITLMNGSNRICVCTEAIVTSEDLNVYAWILKTMSELVPRFSLSRIRIIFGDQFLKASLIERLGISDTVTLRCDYWHMKNQVWPSRSSFGLLTLKKLDTILMEC